MIRGLINVYKIWKWHKETFPEYRTDDIGIGTHKIKAIEKILNDCFEEYFNFKEFEKAFNSPEFKGEK